MGLFPSSHGVSVVSMGFPWDVQGTSEFSWHLRGVSMKPPLDPHLEFPWDFRDTPMASQVLMVFGLHHRTSIRGSMGFRGASIGLPCSQGNSDVLPWEDFHGISVALLWCSHGASIGLPWECVGLRSDHVVPMVLARGSHSPRSPIVLPI